MMKLKGKSGEPIAYRKEGKVNWCPKDKTVLANEQVVKIERDGETYEGCFRCSTKVEQKEMFQWCFRIRDYADELLDKLDELEDSWPDHVVAQQREWIGRSHGVDIVFKADIGGSQHDLGVYTTRADTLFGVTFVAIAAEHPLINEIVASSPKGAEVQAFVDKVLAMDAYDREAAANKEGIDTGLKAVHPLTGDEVPIYVGNYVLMYGTGAVMAVPAHDQRDFEFAKKYDLPIKAVIEVAADADDETKAQYADFKNDKCGFVGHGVMSNSAEFDGLNTKEGIQKVGETLAEKDLGGFTTNYRIRDWGLSRQRYWGAPIPVVHCPDCEIVPVPEDQLPVMLPEDIEFDPTGVSPLISHPQFTKTTCPKCGRADARRETDTMDTFVDSSWYFVRYCDANNSAELAERAKVDRWMPVDQYIGGAEHAILHLIYARFIHKIMRDIGLVKSDEPFMRLFTQGMICKEAVSVTAENHRYITRDELDAARKEGRYAENEIQRRVCKMSKSAKNGVDPETMMESYGADTVRAYTLFMGPAEADSVWDDSGLIGVQKFIKRWWDVQQHWLDKLESASEGECSAAGKGLRRLSHLFVEKTAKEYAGNFGFNTVISKAMETVNFMRENASELEASAGDIYATKEALEVLALCMAPITPHVAEELWAQLGSGKPVVQTQWPEFRKELTVQDEVEIALQVNGKVRDRIVVSKSADKGELEKIAKASTEVQRFIEGKNIRKVIVVPGRNVNIVAN